MEPFVLEHVHFKCCGTKIREQNFWCELGCVRAKTPGEIIVRGEQMKNPFGFLIFVERLNDGDQG